MNFDPIDFLNPEQVKQRLKELKNLDLSKIEWLEFNEIAKNSLLIPCNAFPFEKHSKIFRGQINSKPIPFDRKSRISYNPNPSKDFGRASWPNENVFYGSNNSEIAAIEACQDELRNSQNSIKVYYLTIGEWLTKKDLPNINLICHSKEAQSIGNDLSVFCEKVNNKLKRECNSDDDFQTKLLRNEFFANQFAKKEINCNRDYLFSAYLSSQILNLKLEQFDGICYPSVANGYNGFNFALQTSLIDEGNLSLEKVHFSKICFSNNNKVISFEPIAETDNFDGDNIIWLKK